MDALTLILEQLSGVDDLKALLGGLFAHAPVALQILKADGHCLVVNDAFRALFGSEPPPEYNALEDELAAELGLLELIHRAFAGETIRMPPFWYDPRELRQVHVEEGRRVAIEITLFPLFDGERRIRHVALCFRDLTSELKLQAMTTSLETSNARLREAFDAGRIVSWETNLADGSISVSDSADPVLGLLPGQTLDTLEAALSLLHPEDRPEVEAALALAATEGRAPERRFRLIRPLDAKVMWMEWRSVTAATTADRTVVRGVVMDVTESVRAEEALRTGEARYRAQFEAAPEAIVTLDIDKGCFVEVNQNAERLFGRSRAELYRSDPVVLSPPVQPDGRPSAEAALDYIGRAMRGERLVFEWTHRDAAGKDIPCEVRLVRLPGGSERLCRGSVIDISERKRLEHALSSTQEQLRQSQKMEAIGRLAGGVAHDFNNLLSVILSYSAMLMDDLRPTDPLRADIEAIGKAGEKAAELTRQLLAFSRQQVMVPRVVNLNDILKEAESMLRRLVGEDIEVATRCERNLGKTRVDTGQVDQIIMNLVVNARDAMPSGGKLTLETRNVTLGDSYADEHLGVAPGSYVMLAVSDSGMGMNRETQARIFEPFFTTKEKGKGTGLGLSTVFGIVQQSGGHIWVYSEPGQGTTFKIYFPEVREAAAPPPEVVAPATLRGNETVLLVEDQDEVRVVARDILRRYGYRVLEASNGGEALLECERYPHRIHLLLTDVVMPQISGRDLADRLSRIRPDMRVLYMSGYTENAIVHHAILDSGIEYLQKPIVPELLGRRVREVLDGPPRRLT